MANASNFYIGGNDEHGLNPPTAGKRTPIMPYINRSFYENEFNRVCKYDFLEACLRCGYRVFDVKPEIQDISISQRVARTNAQNLSLVVTFGYNAFGSGTTFNNIAKCLCFYGEKAKKYAQSKLLTQKVYDRIIQEPYVIEGGANPHTGIGMLESVNCTATLIESGFMTNFIEAKLMLDPTYVLNIAEAACKGVCDFLDVSYLPRDDLGLYPLLRIGDSGKFVQLMQMRLNYFKYNLIADGSFGAKTLGAVKDFQTNNYLTANGEVDTEVWVRLLNLYPASTVIKFGSTNSSVMFAQRKLLSKLYPILYLDSDFKNNTLNAVKQFQSENGLEVDGVIGPKTWSVLSSINQGRPLK